MIRVDIGRHAGHIVGGGGGGQCGGQAEERFKTYRVTATLPALTAGRTARENIFSKTTDGQQKES